MSKKPIAIIGSIDAQRTDYDPVLKNAAAAPDAARALGKELAEAGHPILVFSSSPDFLEAYIVEGYVKSGKAQPDSIVMLYPREKDLKIHGEFPAQGTHSELFNPITDPHPRWEASYYQSLPEVEGVLMIGGGRATLIMGLMALANRMPVVSLATFGGNAEEIWAMITNKSWIEAADRDEMGRGNWSDAMASRLVASFAKQRAALDAMEKEKELEAVRIQTDRNTRSRWATVYGVVAAFLTVLGVFGGKAFFGEALWLALYALCFVAIPIFAGMAGAMFFTLRKNIARPPSMQETIAHGLWAGLGSAILFFVSQVTANRDIERLSQAVIDGIGGLDILLLFSLTIGFVAGLTYEAVFGKWEAVDASRSALIETGVG